MQHNIRQKGYSYALRPITIEDAQLIIDIRLSEQRRSQFIHPISNDVKAQEEWLHKYFQSPDDYYFVIENVFTNESEGLIGIYNIQNNKGEWGRWVIKNGSLAAIESVKLIYDIAFEQLGLDELYSRTIEDNVSVVDFHKSIGAKFRKILHKEFNLNDILHNAVEQYVDREYYFNNIQEKLEESSLKIFRRNLKQLVGNFEFEHIGIATTDIDKESKSYFLLGYQKSDFFIDKNQGIKGLFMVSKNQPKLELLENLENSTTLNYFLQNKIKIYHFAYMVDNLDKCFEIFTKKLRAKVVSPMKVSTYFKKRICFLALPNMMIFELIER